MKIEKKDNNYNVVQSKQYSNTYYCPKCGGKGSIRLPDGRWGYCENCRGTGICKH